MQLTSKLPDVGVTIFTVMSQLANELGAINLSQGFPDFNPPPELVDLVSHYMQSGYNQYALMQGALPLREQIALKVEELYHAHYDPATDITITAGATEALFEAITAVVQPGDEVIVFEPAFDSYVPAILLSGGVPVYVQLQYPDYSIDWNQVEDAMSPRTRMMILNSPHNPTGAVLTPEDIEALKQIVLDTPVIILSDEVYEHIIFDGRVHASMARYPELAERSFIVSSFGKTYHATGWKMGYCMAPKHLSAEFQKIHQYVTFASNNPVQMAYADFLQHKAYYHDLGPFYQAKRDTFLNLLQPSRFKALPCHGTYFAMLDYSAITDTPDMEFAQVLTRKHGVAAIPPSVFYHQRTDNHVLRFCFAKQDATLEQAAEKLCQI